ncbi:uncharacterized protein EI97DRAFT_498779 [Westerdykella ornata]|uniref:Uncharacterized protein n=1 Tax=Westerdykella ornata TaxID=318751 RepID=A0A6A6JSQ0_WESOR|nr:uncharacterized protein EI97DRAFT_498779 [Westerdykella ornata]KAF2279274.1 hypothetical protein EI97DRAFT_498779 [Westerdykella ornata]
MAGLRSKSRHKWHYTQKYKRKCSPTLRHPMLTPRQSFSIYSSGPRNLGTKMDVSKPPPGQAGAVGLPSSVGPGRNASAPKPKPIRNWIEKEDIDMSVQYPLAMDLLFELLTIPEWNQPASTDILVRCAKWCPRGGAPFFGGPSDADLATLKSDMGSQLDPGAYMRRQDVQKLAALAIVIGMSSTTDYGLGTRVVKSEALNYRSGKNRDGLLPSFGHEVFGMQVSRQVAEQKPPGKPLDERIADDEFVSEYKGLMADPIFLVNFKTRHNIGTNTMLNDAFVYVRDEIKLRRPGEDISSLNALGTAVGPKYGPSLLDGWTQLYDTQVFEKACKDACAVSTEQTWPIWAGPHGMQSGTHHRVIHARGVNEWLDAQSALQGQDGFTTPIIVDGSVHGLVDDWDDPGSSSCFIEGTTVHTDRGIQRIETIGEGTVVLTRLKINHAEWGCTSDEPVKVLATAGKQRTKVYGINQIKPFFTAGHVFHTTTGLRAIDPKLARIENDWLQVGTLRIGDEVLRVPQHSGASSVSSSTSYDIVTIHALPAEVTTSSHLYGLHLREGLRSYHANGFLVALNYPELTVQRIVKQMHGLPFAELQTYVADLERSQPAISAAFGPRIANFVSQRMKASHPLNPLAEIKTPSGDIRKSRPHHTANPMDLVRSFCLRPRHTGGGGNAIVDGQKLAEVTIVHGRVIIDGVICHRATITDGRIRWSRQLNEGKHEHGQLKFDRAGFSAGGSLLLTPDANRSTLHRGTHILTKADPSSATWSLIAGDSENMKTAFDGGDDISDILTKAMTGLRWPNQPPVVTTPGWEQWPWSVTIGSVSINELSETTASIPEFDALLQSIIAGGNQNQIKAITDKNGNVIPSVIYDSVVYLAGNVMCAEFYINMDWDRIELLRRNKAKQNGEKYIPTPANLRFSTLHVENPDYVTLQGWYQVDQNVENSDIKEAVPYSYGLLSSISSTTGAIVQEGRRLEAQRTAHTKLAACWPSIGSALGDGPAVVTEVMAVEDDDNDYSLGNLMYETTWPATDVSVQQAAQNQVTNAILYHTSKDHLDLFGVNRPDVDMAIQAIADKTKQFLAEDLAKAYLCQGMSSQPFFNDKFDDNKRTRLKYFLSGKGKGTLSQSAEYANATAICSRVAYQGLVGNLNKYRLKDGKLWATQMYRQVSQGGFISGLGRSMAVPGYDGPNLVNRYVMALDTLYPDGTYAKDFANLALNQLADQVSRLKETKFDRGELTDFLQQTMTGLIAQLLGTESFPENSVLQGLKDDINKLGIVGTDLAAATRWVLENLWIIQLSCDIFENIGMMRRGDGVKYSDAIDKWAEENPGKGKIAAITKGTVMFCTTAYSIFKGFSVLTGRGWNDLNDMEKVALVTALIDSTTNLLNGLKDAWDLWKTAASGGAGDAAELDGALGGSVISNVPAPEAIEMENLGASIGENAPESVGSQAARQAVRPPPTGGKKFGFTYWEEDFEVADQVTSFIGFFAGCVATVAIGFQVKEDFDNGQNPGVKALDVLQIIDVGLGTAVGLVAFVGTLAGVSFAFVPVAGAILAVAGLILMIVSLWVHPDPPESAAQKFLDGDGGSWMSNCPAPPDPLLQYSLLPASVKTGTADQSVTLTITNPISATSAAQIVNLIITWAEGDDDSMCLLKSSDDASFVLTSPDSSFACGRPAHDNTPKVQLLIFVTDAQANNAPLKPGDQIKLVFTGKVSAKPGTAEVDIKENTTFTEDTTTYTRDASVKIQVTKT